MTIETSQFCSITVHATFLQSNKITMFEREELIGSCCCGLRQQHMKYHMKHMYAGLEISTAQQTIS